ncbi:MAG: aldehyde dehydrogenase [Alistipes sp.]|nr:aldehyde dehydrogenase [Alistipes sp.]
MINSVEIFSRLGSLLASFGESEASRLVIAQAQRENEWFTEQDVRRAVSAIREQMLDRKRLEEWLSAYRITPHAPRRVGIVMAGNIPAVGFFDMLCVVASGNRALVKLSSKDRVLMRHLIELLRSIEPQIAIEEWQGEAEIDAVIATGGDSANLLFRTLYGSIPHLLRGSRHSVAVLSGRESNEELKALSADIFSYSGLGCRSVSLIFAPQGYYPAITPPTMCEGYRNNYRRTRTLLTMHQTPFRDLGSAVMVEGEALLPAEISRINISHYTDLSQVKEWLSHNKERLQCVVSNIADIPNAIATGRAQYPALNDYADGVDVMEFLTSIPQS